MTTRLTTELTLLYAAERDYKVAAGPVVRQLVADEQRGLPDMLPRVPGWITFDWPASGRVDYEAWWRQVDGGGWRGEYL